tara:strand:- start:72109 stop:72486 length:378 start_codon:yes stop_codon:yes gene_type:complete
MSAIIDEITKEQLKPNRDNFKVGDGVKVYTKIREGDKERIQVFEGIVIGIRGGGIHASFTVRRVVQGEGVERVFALHSPNIEKVEVTRESIVMPRARLNYMRGRIGKKASEVKEKRVYEAKRQSR